MIRTPFIIWLSWLYLTSQLEAKLLSSFSPVVPGLVFIISDNLKCLDSQHLSCLSVTGDDILICVCRLLCFIWHRDTPQFVRNDKTQVKLFYKLELQCIKSIIIFVPELLFCSDSPCCWQLTWPLMTRMSDIGGNFEHMVAWSLIAAPGRPLIIVQGVVIISWCGALSKLNWIRQYAHHLGQFADYRFMLQRFSGLLSCWALWLTVPANQD